MSYKEYIIGKMEEKLIELMGKEAYMEFSTEVARQAFRIEVEKMAASDFRTFVLENFDQITQ